MNTLVDLIILYEAQISNSLHKKVTYDKFDEFDPLTHLWLELHQTYNKKN